MSTPGLEKTVDIKVDSSERARFPYLREVICPSSRGDSRGRRFEVLERQCGSHLLDSSDIAAGGDRQFQTSIRTYRKRF
jgi:hypothetical protein